MENKVDSIIVTHKDRFIRFGYDWFERFLSKYNVKIIVVNNELLSPKEELVQDIISILHVFSCRISELRKYKKKIERDEEIAKSLQSRDKTNHKTNTKNQSKYWSLLDGYIMNIYQRTINYILNTKMDSLIRNRCL